MHRLADARANSYETPLDAPSPTPQPYPYSCVQKKGEVRMRGRPLAFIGFLYEGKHLIEYFILKDNHGWGGVGIQSIHFKEVGPGHPPV